MLRIASLLRPRVIPSTLRLLSSAQPDAAPKISKDALVKLRQKTGYSYVNCRKALVMFGEDNQAEAIKWLKELAAKEGWAKATKLSKRVASQGLVAVEVENNVAGLIELNCETDFVARSDEFKQLVHDVVKAVITAGKKVEKEKAPGDEKEIVSIPVDPKTTKLANGKTISDVLTLLIGKLGENINLAKAEILLAKPGVTIYSHVHPKVSSDLVPMGQFVSLLALGRSSASADFPTTTLASQLCQHIIGMKPEVLGIPPDAHTQKKNEVHVAKEAEQVSEDDELNAFAKVESAYVDEDESQLLRQAFMLHPQQSVHEYLSTHSAQVHWFIRSELGGSKTE